MEAPSLEEVLCSLSKEEFGARVANLPEDARVSLRLLRRRAKNKRSSAESRRRRKEQTDNLARAMCDATARIAELEARVLSLVQEVVDSKFEVVNLSASNRSLARQNQQLREKLIGLVPGRFDELELFGAYTHY